MKRTSELGFDRRDHSSLGSAIWMALIVISGLGLSTCFACVTPFAALATLAALNLGRRDAMTVVTLVWLANQVIGYGFLGYPWTLDSAAWGLAIGVSAGLAAMAASGLSATRPAPLAVSLPFVAAFAAFELSLYIAGFILPDSAGAFSVSVIRHVFFINTVVFCLLTVAHHLVMVAWSPIGNGTSSGPALRESSLR